MSLIKSISGVRGTIGGNVGDNLTPVDIVAFASAYASFIISRSNSTPTVVIGRDARISGEMVSGLVANTLIASGINVIDVGLSTTPSVEMAVPHYKANGGIILTASHNPIQWNALKLLNEKGEFISASEGQLLIDKVNKNEFSFAEVLHLGKYEKIDGGFINEHIEKIIRYPLVNITAIQKANFKVVIDTVNSTGGIALPMLLKKLGVTNIVELYTTPNGNFPHNPEPLAEHLTEISSKVKSENAHLGIVVDPDVDRLALINEDGTMFGEEYTLVAIADYFMKHRGGNTVSNLSSSRALRDVTIQNNYEYHAAAVGEVNVVEMMKKTNAVIGGEGNGGIIVPDFHYGRDALIGIALFLSYVAEKNKSLTEIKSSLPAYFMSKNKIELTPSIDVDAILKKTQEVYKNEKISTIDGVKIDKADGWIHLRKSNTEPIIRIYTEGKTQAEADALAQEVKEVVAKMIA